MRIRDRLDGVIAYSARKRRALGAEAVLGERGAEEIAAEVARGERDWVWNPALTSLAKTAEVSVSGSASVRSSSGSSWRGASRLSNSGADDGKDVRHVVVVRWGVNYSLAQ